MEINKLLEKLNKIVYGNSSIDELDMFLKNNQDILLKENPILLIGLHVDFYIQRGNIKQGLETLSFYQSKPYISMEVEDFMKELKDAIINDSKKNFNKAYSKEQLSEDLLSDNQDKVVIAIRNLSNMNVRAHMSLIKDFLNRNSDERLHKILLIILVEQGINDELVFFIGGIKRKIIPSKLVLPFETDLYKNIIEFITEKEKNPDSLERKKEIFNMALTISFPDNPFIGYDNECIFNVLSRLEKEILGYLTNDSNYKEENVLFNDLKTLF